MADLLTFFAKLFETFQEQIGLWLATVITTGVGVGGKTVWEIWKKHQANRRKEKQSHPVYLAAKQIELQVAADRACVWTGADHAGIYQCSNGEYYSNDDSKQKWSMVGEGTESKLIARWFGESQNLPTSAWPRMITDLEKGHTWVYVDESDAYTPDYEMQQLMLSRGYKTSLIILLKGRKGVWLGALWISWGEGHFTDAHINPNLLEDHRRACIAILNQK